MTNDEQKRVEEIREREEKATPGPWARNVNSDNNYDDDATFIINSRSDIPFLLDLVKRQEEKASSLTAALADRNAEIERLERCAETYYLWYKAALAKEEKRAEAAVAVIEKIRRTETGDMSRADDLRQYVYAVARTIHEWNDPTEEQEE